MIGQTSSIVATVALAVALLLTWLATAAYCASLRASGPDVMGPAFTSAILVGARWLVLALALGLLAAQGALDSLRIPRLLAFLVIAGVTVWVDVGACTSLHAVLRAEDRLSGLARTTAITAGYVLPSLLIVLLLTTLNLGAANTSLVWLALLALTGLVFAAFWPSRLAFQSQRGIDRQAQDDFWAGQKRLSDEGTRVLGTLNADSPLALYLPFLVEPKWPSEIRSAAYDRIQARPDWAEELIGLVSGPDRDLAIGYIAQLSPDLLQPQWAPVVRDALTAQADDGAGLLARSGPGVEEQGVEEQIGRRCQDAANLAYRFDGQADFAVPMRRWRSLIRQLPTTNGHVSGARSTVDHWFDGHPTAAADPTTLPNT